MKLKKTLLGAMLGCFSIASCLAGALLLSDNVDANAESKTSNLIYNLSAESFALGGKNQTLQIANNNYLEHMADGNKSIAAELKMNAGQLLEKGEAQDVSITIDLGSVYNLKHFYMHTLNRQNAGWLIYDLYTSTDGVDYTLIADDVNEYSSEYVTTNGDTNTSSMDINAVGRYFRLDYVGIPAESTGWGHWMIRIYELELYGYSLSSQAYAVDNSGKKVTVLGDETVEEVLSDLNVSGNATFAYCDANGEVVMDTTRKAQEGDIIKITDNMHSAGTEAAAGCYDVANVLYSDTYTVVYKVENAESEIIGNRNVYIEEGASDVIVPLDLGVDKTVKTVKVNGAVKDISTIKEGDNLKVLALEKELKYGENVLEIIDSDDKAFKFIVYNGVSEGEILYYDFDVNVWSKNGAGIVPNEIIEEGIDGKSLHSYDIGGNNFGFYPKNNTYGFAEFEFKPDTEYLLSFDIKILSNTTSKWWCPIRFGETGDVAYIYSDATCKIPGRSLYSQPLLTENGDGSYRLTTFFRTLADGTNTSLDIPTWGGACDIYLDNICIKPINPDAVKIACVGDSITEGSGATVKFSYPRRLQMLLGFEDYYVYNFGRSGTNVLTSGVYPYRVQASKEYNYLKVWKPDIILMQLGTNDGRFESGVETFGEQAFIDDYVNLLEEFLDLAEDKVYINISPYAFADAFNIHADALNNIITAIQGYIAYEHKIDVIDVHSAVKACDRETYFPDYIHGSDDGYQVIAETVANALKGATFINKYHLSYALQACGNKSSAAYLQAKTVYEDENATQKQIDDAYERIRSMIVPTTNDIVPVSLDKEVFCSIASEAGNGIENVTDADTSNFWCSYTSRKSENGAYVDGPVDIIIDLGQEYVISKISLKWRTSSRIYYHNLLVGTNVSEYETVASYTQSSTQGFTQVMDYVLDGFAGRYVWLQITGTASESLYLGLNEFNIYGYSLSETEDYRIDNDQKSIVMLSDNVAITDFYEAINLEGAATGELVKGEGNTAAFIEQGDIYRVMLPSVKRDDIVMIDYIIRTSKTVVLKYGEGQEDTFKSAYGLPISKHNIQGIDGKVALWYLEGTETEWDMETDEIVADIVLVARWSNVKYSITYQTLGGTHDNVTEYTIDDEVVLKNPVKDFYNFLGWYTNYNESTNEYSGKVESISVGTIGDLTLYAKFEEIVFDVVYNNIKNATNTNVQNVSITSNRTLVAIAAEGFIFDGWYLDEEYTESIEAITGSLLSRLVEGELNVYAKWITIYKISFETNGGNSIVDIEYTVDSNTISLPIVSREHYTFGGWYEDSAFTQKIETISTSAEKDYLLYAKWIPENYTVSFYTNGGNSLSDQTVEYDAKVVKPVDPIKDGYTFDGWYVDVACTQAYDFNASVTDDVSLYAKWSKNEQTTKSDGCNGTITMLPICGILLLLVGGVLVKRKSEME